MRTKKIAKGILKTCRKGHQFYKSSDCPSCPYCEKERKPDRGFLSLFSAPAMRAMETHGVKTIKQLCRFTKKEILSWHGIGPASLPAIDKALKEAGLSLKPAK